ncbi:MAG TPA: Zn-ribbon domain-containing OB-fold protein [Acidimicrobiales bacterium]|nr:Zn-ribbon domain-containing OB-fold protein [Acidimicrobiales bacterium]
MSTDAEVLRPAPIVTDDNRFFWEAAAEGRLVAQKCADCGRLHHPPRPMCPTCHSVEQTTVELAGTGTVYSYSILHHPQHPAFSYPVLAVLVELDEGIRMLSNLVDADPGTVSIGLPVEVRFEPTRHDMAVPVFVRRDAPR